MSICDDDEDSSLTQQNTNNLLINEESVSSLIRLALAFEVSKKPLKREDILIHVLNNNGKYFRHLLVKTNERLQSVFGMQLVQLPTAVKNISTMTVAGRKAALNSANNSANNSNNSSNTFILVSTVDRPNGIPYHRNPDRLALLMTILCIIHLSESHCIEEDSLYEKLSSTFNIRRNDASQFDLDSLLSEWKRQRYLVTQRKSDEANVSVYIMGPRAMVEMPPEALGKFVLSIGDFANQTPHRFKERVSASFQ